MLKILIADDVKNVRESIAKKVSSHCTNVQIIGEAESVETCIKAIQQHKPDIILLDIEMQDGTGFDVLKQFPTPSFKVIFVTAYEQYSLNAFRFSALDYLLKPVDTEALIASINKAADHIDREKLSLKIDSFLHNMQSNKGPKKVVLKTSDSIHIVNLSDVIHCEASSGYTTFYMADKTRVVVTRPLADYDEMFSEHNFVRIHQSFLVNINFIKRYEKGDGGNVVLTNETILPVATRKKEQLMQVLSKL